MADSGLRAVPIVAPNNRIDVDAGFGLAGNDVIDRLSGRGVEFRCVEFFTAFFGEEKFQLPLGTSKAADVCGENAICAAIHDVFSFPLRSVSSFDMDDHAHDDKTGDESDCDVSNEKCGAWNLGRVI